MEPDLQRQLSEIKKVVRDNQRLLRKLHRGQVISQIKSIVYIALIAVLSFSFYKSVEPQLKTIMELSSSINLDGFQDLLRLSQ